jgi:signal transduction histidine kinase
VEAASDRLDRLLEVALPLALLLSFGAGYWLAGQALAPLDALTLKALEQDPPARRPLERAREASIDLWHLVERLLLLARAERMGAKEPVDFGAVVLEALEEVETRGKALELDLPHAPCPLKGDPILLKAAVRNLLDNAFKFARSRVRVGLRCQKGILLEVADDGPGVPPGEEERIFEAFHQASPAHRSQGSGLGLALVRRVAELHGGRAVYKRRGEGALFLLELPGEASGAWP